MTATTAERNAHAEFWASRSNTFSAHTGDPGAAGTANEVVGGGYSRQTTTWPGSATGGTITGSQLTFSVPAGTSVTHLGRWNGSTFVGSIDSPDASVSPAGEIKPTPSYTYNGD
ncbi:phage tail fiber protein [Nocardia arizonensis]|uniref:phage tail fiber protein n=1 Tax=Nocardia arizonensis TaxID=1141647 RepID=UPI0006CF23F5|nr:hypothetical protein [Nocardia arizonensis]